VLLVSSDYPNDRVEIFDSCVHCTERIHAVVDRGQIAAVEPAEALVFCGGG
jgi:hypothetical protein